MLRVFAWFAFAVTVVGGVIGAVYLGSEMDSIGLAVMVIVSSVTLALLMLAGLMVYLNMARDVAKTAHDVSEIKQELRESHKDPRVY